MSKFKVGDLVRLKHGKKTSFHVTEVIEQTCYAGVQVHYLGRVYQEGFGGEMQIHRDYAKFLEIELVPIPSRSSKLKAADKSLEALKEEKEKNIRSQDFEKASKIYEEIKALQKKIKEMEELEGV